MAVPSAVIPLVDVDAGSIALVGGKGASLAEMIRAGERVPDGFCITTAAGELADDLRQQIIAAYERLGGGPVAVRSSATAEDLPHASFAGQHETILNVRGADALIDAVQRCRNSLGSERAVAYREAGGFGDAPVRMAVVVQRMVDPAAAGVLFTANPITGTRTEMVVDAVAGLGDVVVEGSVAADHYVLTGHADARTDGCLTPAQLVQLREAGDRLQQRAGSPQDIEFAFDRDGSLWLLQSRAITTLFPLPPSTRPGPRIYFEAGHMQGMLRPFTPMGMSAMRVATALYFRSIGIPANPLDGHPGIVDVAGRMYLDLTAYVRYAAARTKLPDAMKIYGPRVATALARVLDDPRFAPVPGRPYRLRTAIAVTARVAPGLIAGLVSALVRPDRARKRAFRAAADVQRISRAPESLRTTTERVRFAAELQGSFMSRGMAEMLPPLYASMLARLGAIGLLAGVATESEVDETLRGMPHNVTTTMDLALWRLATAAGEHRDLLLHTPPAELAARYLASRTGSPPHNSTAQLPAGRAGEPAEYAQYEARSAGTPSGNLDPPIHAPDSRSGTLAGELPEFGLGEFLRAYGHRGAAEIDVGVPRWAEDPAPVFAAIAGYLRVTDPEQAADLRFARAAAEAVAKIDELVARARRTRPVRAQLAGFLLRRSRALAGLRELPKFAWLYAFAEMRKQLLAAGAELHERGVLDRADDIMFLDFREALTALEGGDGFQDRVAARRAEYEWEMRRRSVPGLLLSDGTNPEALAPTAPSADGTLVGMAAAPGTATGPARVILDPSGAHVEPGEILVAPTTDPGWTPLFLTAGGLVTETGAAMAHGPTVAREYGIPAVICVRDATQLISTGQVVTVDGAAGTVTVER